MDTVAKRYEVKKVSHDDDASKQLEAVEAAIADKAAFIILDNAGADASIEAIQKAYDAGIPCFLIDREINVSGLAVAQIVADNTEEKLLGVFGEETVNVLGVNLDIALAMGLISETEK